MPDVYIILLPSLDFNPFVIFSIHVQQMCSICCRHLRDCSDSGFVCLNSADFVSFCSSRFHCVSGRGLPMPHRNCVKFSTSCIAKSASESFPMYFMGIRAIACRHGFPLTPFQHLTYLYVMRLVSEHEAGVIGDFELCTIQQ